MIWKAFRHKKGQQLLTFFVLGAFTVLVLSALASGLVSAGFASTGLASAVGTGAGAGAAAVEVPSGAFGSDTVVRPSASQSCIPPRYHADSIPACCYHFIKELQQVMGHTDVRTTLEYVQPDMKGMAELLSGLANI